MREEPDAEANPAVGLGSVVPWDVVEVKPLSASRLWVRFADGVAGEVELARLLASPSVGVFARLRDPAIFAQLRIVDGVVTWPGELELAPDAMHDEVRDHGVWTPS